MTAPKASNNDIADLNGPELSISKAILIHSHSFEMPCPEHIDKLTRLSFCMWYYVVLCGTMWY